MQMQTDKTLDLVTVQPKVTVSDGSRRLEWLSIFKAASLQQTVTNRHSSVESPLEPSLEQQKALLSIQNADFSSKSSELGTKDSGQNLTKPNILEQWHSRGARLWLGTTTIDGLDYRTLEYEFDSAISPKWLKELERDKGFIQTALVAQEVRELSARYWAERRAEAQAKAEQEGESPTEPPTDSPAEANQAPLTPQTAPPIDWEYINSQRAMQDALSKKLGASKATYAIYLATNEILTKWKGAGREETPEAIHQAALELLCLRHKIPFDDCFDTEMSVIELDDAKSEPIDFESEELGQIKSEKGRPIPESHMPDTTLETPPHPQSEADNLTLGF